MLSLFVRAKTILVWMEKKVQTDLRYFLRGGLWLGLGQAAGTVASLALGIGFANWLSKDAYGSYQYILSVVNTLTIFTLPEMGTAIVRAVARGEEGDYVPAVHLKQKWAVIGVVVGVAWAAVSLSHGQTLIGLGLLFGSALLPFYPVYQTAESFLQGRRAFQTQTRLAVLSQLVAAVSVLAVLWFTRGALWILATYLSVWTLMRYLIFRWTLSRYPPNTVRDPAVLPYGKQLSLMKGIGTLLGIAGPFFLFHAIGSHSLSAYFVAMAPIEHIRGWLGMGNNLVIQKTAHDAWEAPRLRAFLRKISPMLLVLLGGALLYLFVAPYLFMWIFPKYPEAIFPSQVYMFSLLLTGTNILLSNILKSKRAVHTLHTINMLDALCLFAVTIPFTHAFQVLGLIVAHLIGKMVQMLWMGYVIFFKKRIPAPAA